MFLFCIPATGEESSTLDQFEDSLKKRSSQSSNNSNSSNNSSSNNNSYNGCSIHTNYNSYCNVCYNHKNDRDLFENIGLFIEVS